MSAITTSAPARASVSAMQELEARGEAFTADLTKAVPLLAKKLRFGTGKWEVSQNAGARVLQQLAMQGRLVRGRPRGVSWVGSQYRWVPTQAWLGADVDEVERGPAQAELLRLWLAAFGPATE